MQPRLAASRGRFPGPASIRHFASKATQKGRGRGGGLSALFGVAGSRLYSRGNPVSMACQERAVGRPRPMTREIEGRCSGFPERYGPGFAWHATQQCPRDPIRDQPATAGSHDVIDSHVMAIRSVGQDRRSTALFGIAVLQAAAWARAAFRQSIDTDTIDYPPAPLMRFASAICVSAKRVFYYPPSSRSHEGPPRPFRLRRKRHGKCAGEAGVSARFKGWQGQGADSPGRHAPTMPQRRSAMRATRVRTLRGLLLAGFLRARASRPC